MAQVNISSGDLVNGMPIDADHLRALFQRLQEAVNSIDQTQLNTGSVGTAQLQDGSVTAVKLAVAFPPGMMAPFAGRRAPDGWLVADGSAVSRASYAALFAYLVNKVGDAAISYATPNVAGLVTSTAHGLITDDKVYLTTSATLPAPLAVDTVYFVKKIDANTFNLAATAGGTALVTTSAGSGTHSVYACPHGIAASDTFNLPDRRGDFIRGWDGGGAGIAARGVDTGRVIGSRQASQNLAHTHGVTGRYTDDTGSGHLSDVRDNSTFDATWPTTPSGGTEARPVNDADLICIKT